MERGVNWDGRGEGKRERGEWEEGGEAASE